MRSAPPQRQKAGDITGEVLMRNVVLVLLLVGLVLSVGVVSASLYATGGNETTDGGYYIHTSNGTFTPYYLMDVDYLVVAGGGGSGARGGGGGAGGFRNGTNYGVTAQSYDITVGSGGAGNAGTSRGDCGGNSVFDMITSIGGGGGAGWLNVAPLVGGSGGGGSAFGATSGVGALGTDGEGNAGGDGAANDNYDSAGGGGGAGVVGADAVSGTAGNGGAGLSSSISGSLTWYAGGGGGGAVAGNTGTGGIGGGGAGSDSGIGTDGTANTGGGGGGGGDGGSGGSGGTGVVIIRYMLSISDPDINATLSSPINNTYTQSNNFTFNITGNFSSANATLFIDSTERWNGSITTGPNTASNITLTEGLHSWCINATATISGNTTYNLSSNESFYYDISNPTVPTVQINPDYATISDGTIVDINLSWADNLQLKNGTFYIDTGSGYSEDSNTTLSGTSDWFNTSINTSGMVGNVITWKQEVYDQAGNNFTYSDSFYVALPSLLIYVYDETTGESVLPSDVTVYNEDVSRSATINGSTNISTLDYGNFTTDKYIVRVSADGYYTRRSIALIDIETISSLNVYLPDVNETVIFDQFILTDNTLLYDLSNCIIKLDKPLPNGADTVFSSYFDFDGVASTYLIATDQYILYIETPDSVISYGWLTPDADGQIEIVITDPIEDMLDDWLSYSLTKSDAGSISLTYESEVEIGTAVFYLNSTGGATVYTASISADSGSFTYAADVNESYWLSFTVDNVDGDVKTVTRLIFWNEEGVQPVRMPLLPEGAPDWFYNLLSVGTVLIVILLFSQIRADAACVIGAAFSGLFWYWGWMKVSGIVIAVAALIAIAAIMYKSRREGI